MKVQSNKMPTDFDYDVFLSHNFHDKVPVRHLAERLRQAGLSVWFDEWIIQPGDDIYLAIERGLESSRALILCMSTAAFGSDWVQLERNTALFRDPTNRRRRFIPLLLNDCRIPDTLRRHQYVDWRNRDEREFSRLVIACRPPASRKGTTSEVTSTVYNPLPSRSDTTRDETPSIEGFLTAIGLSRSIGEDFDRYYRLQQLFVPSAEFATIQQKLEHHHFVLITGDPQIGKTYTAIYLLFVLYQNGFQPFWESVRDLETSDDPAFGRLPKPSRVIDKRLEGLSGRSVRFGGGSLGALRTEQIV